MKILILLQFLIALNIRADWQKINSFPSNPVQDIHFSGNIIYAATGSNGVYKSTDGMLSWAEINNGLSNTQALLCKQIISSGGILYVATADGIYKSINSGTNWVRKSAGIVVAGMSYAYCESIFEFNGSLFTGSYTGIYRSTNGGENWLETNVSGTHIWAKKFTLHGGILFAARDVGNSPNGYKSTDNGLTWDDLSTLTVPSITFFSEPGKLFAGTVHGAWLSTDNGGSWVERTKGLASDPYSSSFIRVNGVLLSSLKTGGSGVYKSTNDGILWTGFGEGLPASPIVEELVIFNNKILAAMSSGIYERNASEITGISQVSSEIPAQFSLKQNYPNPFNPGTKIVYSIAELTLLTVKLYDASGKEVSVLADLIQTPGTYEIDFDASYLSSGIYFYMMRAGHFIETKKMILTK